MMLIANICKVKDGFKMLPCLLTKAENCSSSQPLKSHLDMLPFARQGLMLPPSPPSPDIKVRFVAHNNGIISKMNACRHYKMWSELNRIPY